MIGRLEKAAQRTQHTANHRVLDTATARRAADEKIAVKAAMLAAESSSDVWSTDNAWVLEKAPGLLNQGTWLCSECMLYKRDCIRTIWEWRFALSYGGITQSSGPSTQSLPHKHCSGRCEGCWEDNLQLSFTDWCLPSFATLNRSSYCVTHLWAPSPQFTSHIDQIPHHGGAEASGLLHEPEECGT